MGEEDDECCRTQDGEGAEVNTPFQSGAGQEHEEKYMYLKVFLCRG